VALLSTDRLDRLLDENGDITINKSATGISGVIQRIRTRVQIFLEEWFLNESVGIPYFQKLLGHKFNLIVANSSFRKEIAKVQGVVQVRTVNVTFEGRTRTLTIDLNARTEFGDLLTSLQVDI
jgi:hypothetical protein